MRIKVSLFVKSYPREGLNINYNHQMASAIYSKFELVDKAKSRKLHDLKKYFTFSRLFVPKRQIKGNKLIFLDNAAYFYFSSPSADDIAILVEGLLTEPELKISDVKFEITEVKVEKELIKSGDTLKTLSPITIFVKRDGRRYFLDPIKEKKEFEEALRRRLFDRYLKFYGKTPLSDAFMIYVLKAKQKLIFIGKTPYRAYDLLFKVIGGEDLLKFGYKAGFGKKNSMGFGMVEVVDGN